jgi:predicted transcriptional regulator
MTPVIEFTVSDPSIGIVIRPTRGGPEADLTFKFLSAESAVLLKKRRSYALFMEPQLDTGFPDIVLVSFNPIIFSRWEPDRNKITNIDIKILHHLHFTGGAEENHIETQLGLDNRSLIRSFMRLQSAGLVRRSMKHWIPRSLRSTYAISSIKAIEVKIKNWKTAFEQAEINRWFASESYILSPVSNPTDKIIQASKLSGVGLYSMSNGSAPRCLTLARKTQLPICYASWLFNEWIGRYLNR